jgi:hypothetical protein
VGIHDGGPFFVASQRLSLPRHGIFRLPEIFLSDLETANADLVIGTGAFLAPGRGQMTAPALIAAFRCSTAWGLGAKVQNVLTRPSSSTAGFVIIGSPGTGDYVTFRTCGADLNPGR